MDLRGDFFHAVMIVIVKNDAKSFAGSAISVRDLLLRDFFCRFLDGGIRFGSGECR